MSAPQTAAPDRFASFFEAREYIRARTGKAYKGTDPALLTAADALGCGPQVREVLQRYDDLYQAATKRTAELQASGLQELADPLPPEGGPPPLEFPEEWRSQKPGTNALPGYPISDIWNGYESPKYLVKRILAPGEVTVLFGMSGHFKSVVAIDLALSTALGADYHGIKTTRAGVLYVAGEGHAGIKKRARAWMLDRGMDASSDQPAMYVTNIAANLSGRPGELQATVQAAAAALETEIHLVVIDTLAANFGEGDENHASEMQLAISNARACAPQAGILLVHHMGHNKEERERGSYALIAAADCRVMASYDEGTKTVEMAWKKLKDDEMPEPMLFAWRAVPLEWTDDDGEELKSVVLDQLDASRMPMPKPQQPRTGWLGKNQETAVKTLRALIAKARKNLKERGEDPEKACILTTGWRAELDKKGIPRNRINDLQRDLLEREIIEIDGPHVAFKEEKLVTASATGTGHEKRPEYRPEAVAIPVGKSDRKYPDRLVLRTTPAVKNPTGSESPESSDANALPDHRTALADPLAGLAPSQHPEPGSDQASGPAEPEPKAEPHAPPADDFEDFP